jgi:mono/diheme cytochrome c family protein
MPIFDVWKSRAAGDSGAPNRRPAKPFRQGGRAAGLAAAGLLAAITAAAAADPPQAPPAVYTDAQAASGRQVYYQACANCHGEDLAGKVGPALTGRQFHQMVAAQQMTAPRLLRFIATQMPQSKPGSLTPAQYAAIMAFILKQNGYPSGDTPLEGDSQDLGKIDFAGAPKGNG